MKFKVFLFGIAFGVIVAIGCLFFSGCSGQHTREHTLLPVIADAWTELKPYALDADAVAVMDDAVAVGDKLDLPKCWLAARASVASGIETRADAIGTAMADSLRELIVRMDAAVITYSGP
ncbi:MAG: hypothetical protein WC551_11145 [Patescibacteria group bacterium]